MSKSQVDKFCKAHNAELDDNSDSWSIDLSVWAPTGKCFKATGEHSVNVSLYSDKAYGWKLLWSDVKLGLMDCHYLEDEGSCEICGPVEH